MAKIREVSEADDLLERIKRAEKKCKETAAYLDACKAATKAAREANEKAILMLRRLAWARMEPELPLEGDGEE
jgi:hypothetical protein